MVDVHGLSREQLRLQIARGSKEEVWPAFDELIRRNMEEEQESTTLVEITLENSEKWRKLHREDPDATIDIYEEFDGAIEELNWLREQIEAIKIWLKEAKAQGHISISQGMKFDDIIDKEFERSDDSLISRYLALKKFVEDARETVRRGLLQADAPLWFLRTLQRELGVPEEERA